jgi:hypothetical protein
MKNTVLGVVGVLWGGGLIVTGFAKGIPAPTSSYGAGGFTAFLLGVALFAAGAWALYTRRRSRSTF